jgi:hypothetical protein
MVSGVAQSSPTVNPVFNNNSSTPQTFYGWYLATPDGLTLIAAVNIGQAVVPPGSSFVLTPTITDTDASQVSGS